MRSRVWKQFSGSGQTTLSPGEGDDGPHSHVLKGSLEHQCPKKKAVCSRRLDGAALWRENVQWSEARLSSSPSPALPSGVTWRRGPTVPILWLLTCDMGMATLASQDCGERSRYSISLAAVQ